MAERFKQQSNKMTRKLKASTAGAGAGAALGTYPAERACEFISGLGFPDTTERWLCLGAFVLVLILSTALGGMGAGYITRPSKDDGVIKEES